MVSAATYNRQRMALQWSIVALLALLAIVSFLAAYYHRIGRDLVLFSDIGRRRLGVVVPSSGNGTAAMLCNGHANLCDRPANEIVYATVHNGNSAVENGNVLVKNHVLELERAVAAGYRGINFDIGTCSGQVRLVHGTCLTASRDIRTVLRHLVAFLDANPHEVLLIPAQLSDQQFGGGDTVTLAAIADAFASVPGWTERLYDHPGPGQPWPTLRELIVADTRVLFFHYNGETCSKGVDCPSGFQPWFLYAAETQFSFATVRDVQETAAACAVTRGGSGTRDFLGVNDFVTPPRKLAALRTNRAAFVRAHVTACRQVNQGRQVNLILVNYWGLGDLLEVVREMNAAL